MVVELKYQLYFLSIISMLHQKLNNVNRGSKSVVCARMDGANTTPYFLAAHFALQNTNPIGAKTNSGASGGFLPKPLLLRLRHPNSKKISRVFCEILSPKNSFRKTESALVPPPARILGGQNTKEKCPFLFRRNWSRANPKSKEHFSLVSAEALRGGGGADSFVQFPLEKGSRIFKQRAPSKNRLWPVF